MMKRKMIWALMAVFAFSMPLTAQQGRVAGRVVDGEGEPMPYVNVALMRPTDTVFMRGATTDFDGHFAIEGADAGSYLLQASFVGYQSYVKPISIVDASMVIDTIEIRLIRGTTLREVQVVAEKPLYAMDGEKNMYNTREDPSIQTGTASDALQNAPGVEVDAEGNITLRGVSSVEIWINDRPSHMQAEALKQYIKQLPANAIERIEVITNPSARYSTSGGVINIVTNQAVTRNELLCVGVRARTSPNVSPWMSYVWANEKVDFNLYLNADWSRHRIYNDGTSTLFDPVTGEKSRFQSNHDTTHRSSVGGYSGINLNWNISENTNLMTWMGIYPYWGDGRTVNHLTYLEYNPQRDLGYLHTQEDGDGLFWGGYAGAWLEHRFDTTGRKISFSLNANTMHNGDEGGHELFVYNDPLRPNLERLSSSSDNNPNLGVELDYAHPLKNNWEVDAGVEASIGGGTSMERLDTMAAGQYQNVTLRSFDGMERGVDADVYATVQKRWGGLTAKVGLRGEYGNLHSEWQYGDGSGRSVSDTSFFVPVPSIHLSYQTKTFESYSLNYTRRYGNASHSQINPFVRYSEYGYSMGNPDLPHLISYTHNLEAAFSKYVMGFGNIGINAYFRANTNEIGTMTYAGYAPAYFPAGQLVYYTMPVNIGSSHTEGIDANITYRPTAMFNLRLNASVYNYAYTYNDFSDNHVTWSLRANLWTKLWNWLEVFANVHYSSPRLGLYSMSVANKGVDFGVSSEFFDRRLSVFLNVNDIFGMAEWGENTTAPLYQTTGSQRYDSRSISLGLTWRIGKMELESKARQGATESQSPMGM